MVRKKLISKNISCHLHLKFNDLQSCFSCLIILKSSIRLQVLLYQPDRSDSGRKQQCSCIMGSVVVNGEEDVVHACAIKQSDYTFFKEEQS